MASEQPRPVVLVDYGVGNLLSVRWALEAAGALVEQSRDRALIERAERVVVPGVGAYGRCMEELERCELVDVLRDYSRAGRRMLGICVGMQMLLDGSEEFGVHEGLGLIPGTVRRIPDTSASGVPHKIPHIGWNRIQRPAGGAGWENTPLDQVKEDDSFYFVHSYSAEPDGEANVLARANYNGRMITAAVCARRTLGVQFHPEKSGPRGLRLIRRFLELDSA